MYKHAFKENCVLEKQKNPQKLLEKKKNKVRWYTKKYFLPKDLNLVILTY